MVARSHLINRLYHLYVDADKLINLFEQAMSAIVSKRSRNEVNLKYMWHLRLGHIGEEKINRLVKDNLLDSFSDESILICESCLQKKMIKLS